MHPTLFLWTTTLAVFFTVSCVHSQLSYEGYRRLRITPKECTSPRFENVTGVCMFNLECQEKSGTVIGACVDRFLFGACCYIVNYKPEDELDESSTTKVVSTTTELPTTTTTTTPRPKESSSTTPKPITTTETVLFRFTTPRRSSGTFPTERPIHLPYRPQHDSFAHRPSGVSSPGVPANNDNNEKVGPLHLFDVIMSDGKRPALFATRDSTTVLPIALETFSSVSPHISNNHHGSINHMHNSNDQSDVGVEHSTLTSNTRLTTIATTTLPPLPKIATEQPTKLSTFMYIDATKNKSSTAGSFFNVLNTSDGDDESTINVDKTTNYYNENLSSNTENIWSIVMQLNGGQTSNTEGQMISVESDSTSTEHSVKFPLPSVSPPTQTNAIHTTSTKDNTKNKLHGDSIRNSSSSSSHSHNSGSNLITLSSLNRNKDRLPGLVNEDANSNAGEESIWKVTTTSSVSELDRFSASNVLNKDKNWKPALFPANIIRATTEKQESDFHRTTLRPWASSTYQVHTFKYPQEEPSSSTTTTTTTTTKPPPTTTLRTTIPTTTTLATTTTTTTTTQRPKTTERTAERTRPTFVTTERAKPTFATTERTRPALFSTTEQTRPTFMTSERTTTPIPMLILRNSSITSTLSPVSGGLTTWFGFAESNKQTIPSTTEALQTTMRPRQTTRRTTLIPIRVTTEAPTAKTTTSTTITTTTPRPTTSRPQTIRPRPTTEKFVTFTSKPTSLQKYSLPPRLKPTPSPSTHLILAPPPQKTTTMKTTTTTSTTTTTTTPPPTTTTTTTTRPPPKTTSTKPVVKKPISVKDSDIMDELSMDSNLDDFVNQVVQGMAGSLDNLDLDEVILPSIQSEGAPPTLHPLHVLSDPLFPPFPLVGKVPLTKPLKSSTGKPGGNKITSEKHKSTISTTQKPLDYRKDCGVRTMVKSGRIVGGTASQFGRWPWQALVKEATWLGLFSKNKCGGVLISSKYVLTAAHCQPGFLATLTVVLGDFDISSDTESASGNAITKNVRRVIVHRDYNAQTFENDIALLELESAVDYHPHIVPICLPNDDDVFVGKSAWVTGWGRLKYGGGVPQILHEVDVPILNNDHCQEMFQKSGHLKAIRESFICAGYAQGLKDSCEGDSGGPLVLPRPNGQWVLVGTVSHGIKCAYPNLPGVYMRMTFYKPWIKRVTSAKT